MDSPGTYVVLFLLQFFKTEPDGVADDDKVWKGHTQGG